MKDRAETLAAVVDADAYIGACDPAVIVAAKHLFWIQTGGAGVEHCVTRPEMRQRKILLTNAQHVAAPVIAEHVLALMFGISRGFPVWMPAQAAGHWARASAPPVGTPTGAQSYGMEVIDGKTMLVVGLGGTPQAYPQWVGIAPWNNLFLIVIVVWLQAGFAMVLFSAALKGIPVELLEASRMDGANEFQIFFRVMMPYMSGTIVSVWTTIVIFTLKIFDVVWVMTGGQFGTHVIATQFYRQTFTNRNSGFGSAIAIVLLLAVVPVMIYNLRQFREREAF